MTAIDPRELDRRERYGLLVSTVIPRPIGWASTISLNGHVNLAPFSFFAAVSADPWMVMLSIGRRRGALKDTADNLRAQGEAVIHIPERRLAERMVSSSAEVAAEVDEFDFAGLTKVPADIVAPPRIAEAAVAMECKKTSYIELGEGPVDVFFLEVVRVHLDPRILDAEGRPDPIRLEAVGRLGGSDYCVTESLFNLERPPSR